MRTVELGVTIPDAAGDGDVTVVFATCSPKVASTASRASNEGVDRDRRHARLLTRRRLIMQQPIKRCPRFLEALR